jgi:hypothetical protein
VTCVQPQEPQDVAQHSCFIQTVTIRVPLRLPFPSFLQQPPPRRHCPLLHCPGHHQHLAPASSCGYHHPPAAARTRAAPCSGWPASPPCARPAGDGHGNKKSVSRTHSLHSTQILHLDTFDLCSVDSTGRPSQNLACFRKTRCTHPLGLVPKSQSTSTSFPSTARVPFLLPGSICCYCCQLLPFRAVALACCLLG